MIPANLAPFVSQVTKATSAGQLSWEERDHFGRELYLCKQNDYLLEIANLWNDDTESFAIHFSIQMPDHSRASFSTSQWEDDYPQMRSLYELATISAANINPDSLKGFFG